MLFRGHRVSGGVANVCLIVNMQWSWVRFSLRGIHYFHFYIFVRKYCVVFRTVSKLGEKQEMGTFTLGFLLYNFMKDMT